MNSKKTEGLLGATAGKEKRGFDWLGFGYKGYQYYAALESKTPYAVYDMSKLEALFDDVNESTLDVCTDTNKTEYYKKRFADVKATGNYELYSATVTANFDNSTLTNYNATIGTGMRIRKNYRLTIPDGAPLDETFSKEIKEMQPEKFYEKYGTHVLRSFIVGGRYEASSYVDDSREEDKSSVKASLEGGLKMVFNVSAGGGGEDRNIEQSVKDRATIKCYGGGMEKDYETWFKNLNEENAAISAFEENSIVPLYELLTDDEIRKQALKKAFDDYMKTHAESIMLQPDPQAPVKPSVGAALKYGDHFNLETEDGVYVVSAFSNTVTDIPLNKEYYPTLAKAEAATLYFAGDGKGEIDTAKSLAIKTTEKGVGEYNTLGRFTDSAAYYYTPGNDEQKWVATKLKPTTDTAKLFDDDVVEISMLKWPTYFLCVYKTYLSTTGGSSAGCGTTKWRIKKCK
jgi:hypothetical protein